MHEIYVKELLEVKGNLTLFREVARSIGNFLSLQYINTFSTSSNTIMVPVLRAGMAFEKSFLKRLYPSPRIYYIAAKRDPETIRSSVLYQTLDSSWVSADTAIILEPMLATGGTINLIIELVDMICQPKNIVVISAFVSKKAEKALGDKAAIVALSTGHEINDKGYILIPDPFDPKSLHTLDFGDEYCGTYH